MAVSTKLHGAAGARPMAAYLYNGAVQLSLIQEAALDFMQNGSLAAMMAVQDMVEAELRAEYREVLEGLHLAFVASGDWDRARVTTEIAGLHELDWERFEELTTALRVDVAKAGMTDHVLAVYRLTEAMDAIHDMGLIEATAWERISQTWGEMTAGGWPVRLHASAEMQALLKTDRAVLDPVSVANLLANRTADGARIPGKRYQSGHEHGEPSAFFEVCFSADKSVSVAKAFAGPEDKAAIRAVHEAAVEAGMREISARTSQVRVRAGGGEERHYEPGEGAWVSFAGDHTQSRKGDPQLHTHVALLNVVRSTESGRVGSFALSQLHGHFKAKTFERAYQQELARGLAAIGMDIAYDRRDNVARVQGLPEAMLEAFSSRKAEAIEAVREALRDGGVNFDNLTPEERSRWLTEKSAETRRPANQTERGQDDWVAAAIKAVGTEEWERMAQARGWTRPHQRQYSMPLRAKESKERFAAGLPEAYHRGGSREMDWGLSH